MVELEFQHLSVAQTERVLHLGLNRPERRNALNARLVDELYRALKAAEKSEAVSCIVLKGEGGSFCAGGDFSQMSSSKSHGAELGGATNSIAPDELVSFDQLLLALVNCSKPVIAQVQGQAFGGGLGLVAACTFAVADEAAQFATPEIQVGLFPFMIMAVLERVMGRRALTELMLLGERVSAQQALQLGLLSRVAQASELEEQVAWYTTRIVSKSSSTLALGLRSMRDSEQLSLEEKLPLLHGRLLRCLGTADAQEGLSAFLEKRKPQWTGR